MSLKNIEFFIGNTSVGFPSKITIDGSLKPSVVNKTLTLAATPLSFAGDLVGSGNGTVSVNLANTGVIPGSYGSGAQALTLSVDAKGRITSVNPVAISFPVASVAGRTGNVVISSADITDATSASNASTIVRRDAAGSFTANTVTATLLGQASTASKLTTARGIYVSGDALGSASFDGSSDASIALTLANSGVVAGAYGSTTQTAALTIDTKGRVIAAVPTAIAFPVTSVAGRTGNVNITSADITDAASASALNSVVKRDGNGSFVANIITATLNGQAATAGKLAAAQTISISGDATASTSFDGSASATLNLTLTNVGVTAGSYGSATAHPVVTIDAKGRVTSVVSTPIAFPVSTVAGRTGNVVIASADITDATAAGTASTVVRRDASGSFSANTITATLAGQASTAGKLATAQTISISGDATASTSFDGSTAATLALTLAATGITAGTYGTGSAIPSLTIDAKGRVTAAAANVIAFPVTSVNGKTGNVSLSAGDVNAVLRSGDTMTGGLKILPSGGGGLNFVAGDATHTGYIEFKNADGSRQGYIGYADTNYIPIGAEAVSFNFIGKPPLANGNVIWHAGNLTPVTSVNGKTGALTLAASDVGAAGLTASNSFTGLNVFKDGYGSAITNHSGETGGLEVRASLDSSGNGYAAAMMFHRPGIYATWFGLDTDSQFKFGGWSEGTGVYRFWTEKNFNPASYPLKSGDTYTGQHFIPLAAQTPPNGNITQRVEGGFYNYSACTKALGWPEDSNSWSHLIASTHTNGGNYYSLQIAGGFFDNQNFYIRKTANVGTRNWNTLWHSGPFATVNDTAFHNYSSSENGYTAGGGSGAFYIPRVIVHTMTNPVGHREMSHHEIHSTGAQQGHFVVGANIIAWGHAAPNNGASSGSIFGFNCVGIADSGMSGDTECSGAEVNTVIKGAIARKTGLQIVDSPGSSGYGTAFDAGLLMGRGDGSASGYYTGIQIGTGDANQFPVRGNIMSTGVGSCQLGIDMRSTTFNSAQALLLAPNQRITWSAGTGGFITSNTNQNGPQMVFGTANIVIADGNGTSQYVFDIGATSFRPAADAALSLGNPGYRWGVVFSQTGQINTSSRLQKRELGPADDAFLDAIGDIDIVQFQFLDAVKEKGEDKARIHSGVIAEQLRDALVAKGFDPTRYSFFCMDPEEETVEETYEEDEDVMETFEEEDEDIVIDENGRAVMRKSKTVHTRQVFETLPVFNEDGTPHMTSHKVVGDDNKMVVESRQTTTTRKVTKKVTKTRTVTRQKLDEDGKPMTRLGVRYGDLTMMMLALARRQIKRQQAEIEELKKATKPSS